jgi:ATP-dependent exoDNAse (exonuclease V) beta subunit
LIPSKFNIIGAAAGSGKTFAVTKAYLKIVLSDKNDDAFKHILAITFTNKAVGEMKERIINSLKAFADERILEQHHPMFEMISKETGLSPDYLHERSKVLLTHMLHNYGGFEISTIDSFVHRIIRTFAKDLKLPSNFEVELDQDGMLAKTVDHLISEATPEEEITRVLVDFALEKSDEDKSFDISYDLNKIAKLLISEKDRTHVLKLEQRSLKDFSAWKKQIKSCMAALEQNLKLLSQQTLELFNLHHLEPSDFLSGLGNYFINLSQGTNVNFDAAWQRKLEQGEPLYLKKTSEDKKKQILELQPQIIAAFLSSKALVIELWLEQALYKNLVPLSILRSLQSTLQHLKAETQKLLISEFNSLIHNEIKNQPTPYIFERLGEKFKHYFVDEFQDTSVMQWQNLVPLMDNSLSGQNNSATIVGDAKQAIYRWRGGEASQFIDLLEKVNNPFQIPAAADTLDSNFRSSKTIVAFNNGFFAYLSGFVFNNPMHAALFKSAPQKIENEATGYVQFQFFETSKEEDKEQPYCEAVQKIIEDCLERGYQYQDLCVLVRKHKHGVAVARHLGGNGIPITSSEALLLKNSSKVRLIVNLLELELQTQNDLLKVSILHDLAEILNRTDTHDFISGYLPMPMTEVLKDLYKENDVQWLEQKEYLPLYDKVECYLHLLEFNKTSDAFLQFLLDLILDHSLKGDGGINSFIEYYRTHEEKLSISSPEDRNAVSVMTIHRAKGLEFPVVIFPYADVNIYEDRGSHLWLSLNPENNAGFSEGMVSANKQVTLFNQEAAKLYEAHQTNLELDHINLLYVALTRPVNEMYLICKKDLSSKKEINLRSFAGLFISYLEHQGLWQEQKDLYYFGEKTFKVTAETRYEGGRLNFVSAPRNPKQFKILTSSGLLWDSKQAESIERGRIVHLLLSHIKTLGDLPFALDKLIFEGVINQKDRNLFEELALNIIEHPDLRPYFSTDFEVYNEQDLIGPNQQILRPDRLCLKKDLAVIIDYKTGTPAPSHSSQVEAYKNMTRDLGLVTTMGLLVYINDSVKVVAV